MERPGIREILASAVFIVIVGGLFLLCIFVPAPDFLLSERRVPARAPELSFNSVASGSFMDRFGDYAADSFVFRDGFRRVSSIMRLDVFLMGDKSGLYRDGDVGIGEFRRTDEAIVRQAAERIGRAAGSLAGLDMNIYYSVIPDKSVFAGRYLPGFDIGVVESTLFETLGEQGYIRIYDKLDADSFYRTDLHWDQVKIGGVADHILSAMGAGRGFEAPAVLGAGVFSGVYSGQLALPVKGDSMSFFDVAGIGASYLDEAALEFETGPVYDDGRFGGVDPYDFFLRGPQPLVVIENEGAPGRELYVFRDSFGSSIAPLLAAAYERVTLIDLRYIHFMMLDRFIDFNAGADVLFLYSSQILNNPGVLQV